MHSKCIKRFDAILVQLHTITKFARVITESESFDNHTHDFP